MSEHGESGATSAPRRSWLDLAGRIHDLLARTSFPLVEDVGKEQDRLNLFRIVFGWIILGRYAKNAYGAFFYFDPGAGSLFGLPELAVSHVLLTVVIFCFMVGFLTPLCSLLILLYYTPLDVGIGGRYLANSMAGMLIAMMLFSNVGSRKSVDAWILRHPRWRIAGWVRRLYSVIGFPTREQQTVVFFFAFVTYGLLNIAANLWHAMDPYWRDLSAIQVVLTSSVLSAHPWTMRAIEAAQPGLFHWFFASVTVVQVLYEFLMVPAVLLHRATRYLVIAWAFCFYAMTQNLMLIAVVEELSALIMISALLRPHRHARVLIRYDSADPVQRLYVGAARFFDWFGSLELSEARGEIVVRAGGRELRGLAAARRVCMSSMLLWPAVPVLAVLELLRFDPAWIRRALAPGLRTGQVPLPRVPEIEDLPTRRPGTWVLRFVYPMGFLLLGVQYLLGFPFIENLGLEHRELRSRLYRLGMEIPGVYNTNGLAMGDRWPVIHRVLEDGGRELVPFNSLRGERLAYWGYDFVFVQNAVMWRRSNGGKAAGDLAEMNGPDSSGFGRMKQIMTFDARLNPDKPIDHFEVDIYQAHQGWHREMSLEDRYRQELVYSYLYFSGDGLESERFVERDPAEVSARGS